MAASFGPQGGKAMTPEQLREAAVALYGPKGSIRRLAEALGLDYSTMWRYLGGKSPITGPVEAAVKCFLDAAKCEAKKQ